MTKMLVNNTLNGYNCSGLFSGQVSFPFSALAKKRSTEQNLRWFQFEKLNTNATTLCCTGNRDHLKFCSLLLFAVIVVDKLAYIAHKTRQM